jgi:hypothetical protein
MDGMNVELLVVPGCARQAAAVAVLMTALEDIGLGSVGCSVTIIESHQEADRRHFIGSPTFCIDGEDIFPEPDRPASIACRLYPGPDGVPELRDLRRALKRAAAVSASR